MRGSRFLLFVMSSLLPLRAALPVRYFVQFPAPDSHYAEVRAIYPAPKQGPFDLFLPVWTPGSYLVREYSRNLENVRAENLQVEKTRKNRWRISGEFRGESVEVAYRVYCRELSVRTNWVDAGFALLNGAATFLAPVGGGELAYEVELQLPSNWKTAVSGLEQLAPNRFHAADYDTLVDSPIVAGNPDIHEFSVEGKRHFLANVGETQFWDAPRAAADAAKIVAQYSAMWGNLPYRDYSFLNLIVDSGGGIEHKNSTTLMTGRYATRTRKAYLSWLGLVSHEFFHAWNVKRLRPVELGPFDYENEVYTRGLWVAEGFTEYYGGLGVRRSGLATDAEYLGAGAANEVWNASLSSLIDGLQTTPGRLAQPVAEASYDAWIKLYRPDENSGNTTVSYYVKGAVIAWLLDAKLRALTNGAKSLDDVMRAAYAQYSGDRGYTLEQFADVASSVAGSNLNTWFHRTLDTTDELDFTEALDWFGLEFKKPDPPKPGARPKTWTGFQTRADNGRLIVTRIPRDTPAERAGLSVDDEILAVDDFRVTADGWNQRLEQYLPNDTVHLLVSRRDRVIGLDLRLAEEPFRKWQLQVRPQATAEQKTHFAAWLSPSPVAHESQSH